MEQYTGFAQVYDMFMDNVPYDDWADYLHTLLKENGINDGIVAELGCGTGKMTRRLRDRGYDMIGIDISDEMLQIAIAHEDEAKDKENEAEPKEEKGGEILYLCQDMREFELYGSVAAVVSICDSMNYITEAEELLQVFRLVNNYLDPGGLFVFDLNTEYYYKYVLGEQTICENREAGSFIWENYYDAESGINEFDMTVFVKNSDAEDCFRRFTETHYQRAYKITDVRRLLKKAGMKNIRVYASQTHDSLLRGTERVYFLAEKP